MTKKKLVEKMLDGWSEETFCQGVYNLTDKKGIQHWCLSGRLFLLLDAVSQEKMRIFTAFREDFEAKYNMPPVVFNDTHTFAEVKEALENLYK